MSRLLRVASSSDPGRYHRMDRQHDAHPSRMRRQSNSPVGHVFPWLGVIHINDIVLMGGQRGPSTGAEHEQVLSNGPTHSGPRVIKAARMWERSGFSVAFLYFCRLNQHDRARLHVLGHQISHIGAA